MAAVDADLANNTIAQYQNSSGLLSILGNMAAPLGTIVSLISSIALIYATINRIKKANLVLAAKEEAATVKQTILERIKAA